MAKKRTFNRKRLSRKRLSRKRFSRKRMNRKKMRGGMEAAGAGGFDPEAIRGIIRDEMIAHGTPEGEAAEMVHMMSIGDLRRRAEREAGGPPPTYEEAVAGAAAGAAVAPQALLGSYRVGDTAGGSRARTEIEDALFMERATMNSLREKYGSPTMEDLFPVMKQPPAIRVIPTHNHRREGSIKCLQQGRIARPLYVKGTRARPVPHTNIRGCCGYHVAKNLWVHYTEGPASENFASEGYFREFMQLVTSDQPMDDPRDMVLLFQEIRDGLMGRFNPHPEERPFEGFMERLCGGYGVHPRDGHAHPEAGVGVMPGGDNYLGPDGRSCAYFTFNDITMQKMIDLYNGPREPLYTCFFLPLNEHWVGGVFNRHHDNTISLDILNSDNGLGEDAIRSACVRLRATPLSLYPFPFKANLILNVNVRRDGVLVPTNIPTASVDNGDRETENDYVPLDAALRLSGTRNGGGDIQETITDYYNAVPIMTEAQKSRWMIRPTDLDDWERKCIAEARTGD